MIISVTGRCRLRNSVVLDTGVADGAFKGKRQLVWATLVMLCTTLSGIVSSVGGMNQVGPPTGTVDVGLLPSATKERLKELGFVVGPKNVMPGKSGIYLFLSNSHLYLAHGQPSSAAIAALGNLSDLKGMFIYGTQMTDVTIEQLCRLRQVHTLVLIDTKVTDAGLKYVAEFSQLREFSVNTSITADGLKYLSKLKHLRLLSLAYTSVDDAGVRTIKTLTGLQDLDLSFTKVTDAGLEHLRSLAHLQRLNLSGTCISDTGLAHLKGLSHLQALFLNGTSTTDAGLRHISKLAELRILGLEMTKVTDSGLELLQGLDHLQELYLIRTQITDKGLKYLGEMDSLQIVELGRTGTRHSSQEEQTLSGTKAKNKSAGRTVED